MHAQPALSTSSKQQKTPAIWSNRNFLLLFLSYVGATLGSKIYSLALPLILYAALHSPVPMSTMRSVEFLPNLLLAMFIGVFVDSFRKKRWTQAMLVSQIVLLGALYGLGLAANLSVYVYYVFGFFLMTFNYGYQNGRMSMVKYSVPSPFMTHAVSYFSLVSTVIDLLGPALSGFILMLASPKDGLLFTCLLYVLSCSVTLVLRDDEPVQKRTSSFWSQLRLGWGVFTANRPLVIISILVVFLNSSAGMMDAMLVFFAKDHLHLNNGVMGLVLSASGVGGLLGSLVVPHVRKRWGLSTVLGMTIIALSATYLCMYMAQNAWVMAVALFMDGVFSTVQNVCIWTYRQESAPAEMIGRISGITGSIFKLGMPFAIFSSGFIAQSFGTSAVFLSAAVLNVVIFGAYVVMNFREGTKLGIR